jgi:DNA-binding transcriptional LysR family regulator
MGRPSIDPELMIRMLIVGYCFGIRSERRLCGGAGMRLITMDTAFAEMPDTLWLDRALPEAQVVMRSNSRLVQAEFCRQGSGLAVLPRPLGDRIPGIVPIDMDETPPGRDTNVGYHRDPRRLSRLRTLLDMVIEHLAT